MSAPPKVSSLTVDGLKTTYSYDESTGRLLSTQTKKSDGTGYSLESTSTPLASDPNYTVAVTDVNGNKTSYEYTTLKGLVTKATYNNGISTGYAYDANTDRPTPRRL